jgi:hypothetical protein
MKLTFQDRPGSTDEATTVSSKSKTIYAGGPPPPLSQVLVLDSGSPPIGRNAPRNNFLHDPFRAVHAGVRKYHGVVILHSLLACVCHEFAVLLRKECHAGFPARKSSRLHTYLGGPDRDFPGEFLHHP